MCEANDWRYSIIQSIKKAELISNLAFFVCYLISESEITSTVSGV